MSEPDPIELLFGGMEKLGPGSDADTLHVLRLLPDTKFRVIVVSELSWLSDDAPAPARDFFRSGYPGMRSLYENMAVSEEAGFRVLATHTLPKETWTEGYYDVLEPRANDIAGKL